LIDCRHVVSKIHLPVLWQNVASSLGNQQTQTDGPYWGQSESATFNSEISVLGQNNRCVIASATTIQSPKTLESLWTSPPDSVVAASVVGDSGILVKQTYAGFGLV